MRACVAAHEAPVEALDGGFLCVADYERVSRALYGWTDSTDETFALDWAQFSGLVLWIGTVYRPENVGAGSRPDGYTPLLKSSLDIDAADRFLVSFAKAGANLQAWVSRMSGATDALDFARASIACRKNHPLAEADRALRPSNWECPGCRFTNPDPVTLWVRNPKPSAGQSDDRFVECGSCGHRLTLAEALSLAMTEEWRAEHAEEIGEVHG